jgi:hypothetical protein
MGAGAVLIAGAVAFGLLRRRIGVTVTALEVE